MAFRNETDALRARVESLERELASARERVAELEQDSADSAALRERVGQLEAELGKRAAPPAPSVRGESRPESPGKAKRGRLLRSITIAVVMVIVAGVLYMQLAPSGPAHDVSPVHGVVDLDADPAPRFSGAVVGESPAGNDCPGHLPSRPFVVLRTGTARRVEIWTESSADLVLYVRTAEGRVVCDDDSGQSLNAHLVVDLPAGDHAVWMGTYSRGMRVDAQLVVNSPGGPAMAIADAESPLATVRIDGVARHERQGQAQGDQRAREMAQGCLGHVPTRPQLELQVDRVAQARLIARGPLDLVMLLQRPDGSYACDDDSAGDLDPMLEESLQLGTYRVWIGTYQLDARGSFRFSVEVEAPRDEPEAAPRLGRWSLETETLLTFSERVGGSSPLSSTQPDCQSLYGSATPEVELELEAPRTVTLTLTSAAPLGLLVEHPDGTQICDRSRRTEPHAWGPGAHRVWVGSPSPGAAEPFTLVVSAPSP